MASRLFGEQGIRDNAACEIERGVRITSGSNVSPLGATSSANPTCVEEVLEVRMTRRQQAVGSCAEVLA